MKNKESFRSTLLYLFYGLAFALPIGIDFPLKGDSLNVLISTEPITGLLTLGLLIYAFLTKHKLSKTDKLFILILLGTIISSVFSTSLVTSLKYTITIIWYSCSGYLFVILIKPKWSEWKMALTFYLTACFLLTTLVHFNYYIYGGIFQEIGYRVSWPFIPQGHTNLSSMLEPAFLVSIGGILLSKTTKRQLLFTFLTIYFYAAIEFSWSRASILTTSLVIAGTFLFLIKNRSRRQLVLLVIAFAVPHLIHYGHDYYHKHYRMNLSHYNIHDISTMKINRLFFDISLTDTSGDHSSKERVLRWKNGLNMFTNDPITGIGPGTFADYNLVYNEQHPEIEKTSFSDIKKNIHNIYLGWLVEGGLLIFLPMLTLLILVWKRCFIIIKERILRKKTGVIKLLLCFYVGTFCVQGLFQDFNNESRNILPFWIIMALLLSMGNQYKRQESKVKSSL